MKRIFLSLCLLLCADAAWAEAAFQFSVPGFQAPKDPDVSGFRLSILYGKNESQSGLDLGFFSWSESSKLSGLALIGGISKLTGDMASAAAFSLINIHGGRDSGVNGAFINLLNNPDGAFNTGFVTIAKGETLVDLGGFNMSKSSTAQIGFLNMTDEIKSFQFGFLNMAKNGFFPVFPVVNFPKK
jgi:hypothetical protein